ncbi:MAG: hypothetical protein VW835_02645 [Rickettsiales bacterium]|jgi:Mg2+ and Co2+ transporter CorA
MPRVIEKIAICAFILLSAPIISGLMTTVVAAAYFMLFSQAPIEEARALGPFFLIVAAVIYATLCWHVLKAEE